MTDGHEEPHGVVTIEPLTAQIMNVPFESQEAVDYSRFEEALKWSLDQLEGGGVLEARGALIPSPDPEGPPLMGLSYKVRGEVEWTPTVYSGFKRGPGAVETTGAIYVETIHHVGCDVCGKMDPPFLRMEDTGDQSVSACLGCVKLALDADEECHHDWDPVAFGPYFVESECSKCEATKKEPR